MSLISASKNMSDECNNCTMCDCDEDDGCDCPFCCCVALVCCDEDSMNFQATKKSTSQYSTQHTSQNNKTKVQQSNRHTSQTKKRQDQQSTTQTTQPKKSQETVVQNQPT